MILFMQEVVVCVMKIFGDAYHHLQVDLIIQYLPQPLLYNYKYIAKEL